jgi:hypothetical protein
MVCFCAGNTALNGAENAAETAVGSAAATGAEMKPVAGTDMGMMTGQHPLVAGSIMKAGRGGKWGTQMGERGPAGS